MKIYVAGPMTGIPSFNFPAFDEAAAWLRDMGHDVCNPAEHDRETHGNSIEASVTGDPADAAAVGFSLREALAYDLDWIARNADAVAVLPGWEGSKGAAAEIALARALGLIVAPWDTFGGIAYGEDLPVKADRITPDETTATSGEVRTVSSTGGEKGVKLARFDLIPANPLRQVAEHYGKGAAKYDARNWERGYEWSKSFGALMRHAWQWQAGEDIDVETQSNHMAAVAFHAFALLEFAATHREFDDRPTIKENPAA